MSFEEKLKQGQAAESAIAKWLRSRGYSILPIYEKIFDTGKGPQIFTPTDELVAPDLLVFRNSDILFVEAKHKTAFSWHRNGNPPGWVTGIDRRHYENYLRVDSESPFRVWLLFLHDGGHAKDSPSESPSGLFGNEIRILKNVESHRSDRWGTSGMVYWKICNLLKIAERELIQ